MIPARCRRTRMLLALTAAVGVLAACGPAGEDVGDAEPDPRDAEIERLEAEVAELEAELARLRDEEPVPPAEGPDRPAAPRTEEGLVEQLHGRWSDPQTGFEPGPTPWEAAEVPAGFGDSEAGYDSAGELMTALAAELAGAGLGGEVWEAATRVLLDQPEGDPDADEATGAVLLWGFLDDSVAGADHRFALRRGADGWFAESAEQRSQCARGVAEEEGLCV